ncbi:MAG TPA: hypothetical protein VGM94_14530 [Galbitalea sp.]
MDDDEDQLADSPPQETVDAAISAFFLLEHARASGARQRRLERASDDLRECLEAVAERILTTRELAVLDLELQFQPFGAAARIADADALLFALCSWLEDSRWHGNDFEDRRLRVHLALPLARFVTRLPRFDGPVDGGCAMWDVEAAVRQARREIRVARGAAGSASKRDVAYRAPYSR